MSRLLASRALHCTASGSKASPQPDSSTPGPLPTTQATHPCRQVRALLLSLRQHSEPLLLHLRCCLLLHCQLLLQGCHRAGMLLPRALRLRLHVRRLRQLLGPQSCNGGILGCKLALVLLLLVLVLLRCL